MQEYKTSILPRSLYFFIIIHCLKFWQPDLCPQADQQTAVNLVQVERRQGKRSVNLKNPAEPNHGKTAIGLLCH